MIIALGVFLAIAVGSCMQRVSGMGVGLITGPVISILLGPVEGIMVLNILACANAAATTVTVRRNVQWRYVWLIGSVLVIGSVPAAFLIAATETAPLLIIVGALLLIALAVVTFGKTSPVCHWTHPGANSRSTRRLRQYPRRCRGSSLYRVFHRRQVAASPIRGDHAAPFYDCRGAVFYRQSPRRCRLAYKHRLAGLARRGRRHARWH